MLESTMKWMFGNFDLCMFILAAIFVLANSIINRQISTFEILYRWFSLFPLGFTLIYVSILRAFYPELTEVTLGRNVPFQFEVALACFSLGVVAILSFKASYGFRLATVISSSLWIWGNAISRIQQLSLHPSLASGSGSWLLLDLVLPILLALVLIKLRPSRIQRL